MTCGEPIVVRAADAEVRGRRRRHLVDAWTCRVAICMFTSATGLSRVWHAGSRSEKVYR